MTLKSRKLFSVLVSETNYQKGGMLFFARLILLKISKCEVIVKTLR